MTSFWFGLRPTAPSLFFFNLLGGMATLASVPFRVLFSGTVLCDAVLCDAVLCDAVLGHAVLCCAVLCCALLCCAMLCYAVLSFCVCVVAWLHWFFPECMCHVSCVSFSGFVLRRAVLMCCAVLCCVVLISLCTSSNREFRDRRFRWPRGRRRGRQSGSGRGRGRAERGGPDQGRRRGREEAPSCGGEVAVSGRAAWTCSTDRPKRQVNSIQC